MRYRTEGKQSGLSLVSLIIIIAVVGVIAVLILKVFPTATEYYSIKKAIVAAKNAGSTEREIRNAFDRHANAGYIDSINGSDLGIERVNNSLEVSFSYEKKIPLFGPASLLIEYEGSTAKSYDKKDGKAKNK